MQQYPQLPPGLTPVQAGRFGLWMLGQRSHRRALQRTVSVSRVPRGGLCDQFIHLYAPWTVNEYPGRKQILAELLGVKRSTVRDYLYRSTPRLPEKHRATLERLCRERGLAFLALADELAGKKQNF
jgi:hypothetical protein